MTPSQFDAFEHYLARIIWIATVTAALWFGWGIWRSCS